ncbi:MAG: hypothetical protein M3327_08405 [Actinomycetota bacterium]|nr:hypothetical protein [Actinomycetota bacterium]
MVRLRPLYIAVFLAAVLTAPAALAGSSAVTGPPDEHFRDVGTDVDTDFCGTGKTVDIAFNVRVNLWHLPEDPRDFAKLTQSGKVTFTNPENGRTVRITFAGRVRNTIVSGDPLGVHTHVYTTIGLAEKIQTLHGRVLLRDAGLIVERITFDENGEVIDYEATWKGPHPEAASDFELFCQVTTRALGL